jgi:galactokinase
MLGPSVGGRRTREAAAPEVSAHMSDTTAADRYIALHGTAPEFVVRAPGRVNLIGEHTDYNDGFVLPAAIDFDVTIAGSLREDRNVHAYSTVFDQSDGFTLDDMPRSTTAPWSNYLRGVATILQEEGYALRGMNAVVHGTVPLGSGLSSSAAIEMASCLAFECTSGFVLDGVRRALLSQRAEREFVGVQCGIMDQFISSLGRAGHALFIDTRTLDYEAVPLAETGVAIIIANTNKQRGLVDSEYNTRRSECEQAVSLLATRMPGIRALRDVKPLDLARYSAALPENVLRRARHVVSEDERVLESVASLKAGDLTRFGRLMNASHDSLRDDYGVSCRELDVMVDAARSTDGTLGSRMTGAGFGGCTVSLVDAACLDAFTERVGALYRASTGLEPAFYVCKAAAGADRLA